MFTEFAGLTQEVASLIEAHRKNDAETKSEILWRILPRPTGQSVHKEAGTLSFGQGIQLPVGEKIYLYLSKPKNDAQKPDGWAEVRSDGLYLDGMRVTPSHGSSIAPAMHAIQKRLGHVNDEGNLVSLSAYRQWHVVRDGKLVALDALKSPEQRRHRRPKESKVDVEALLAEFGIK